MAKRKSKNLPEGFNEGIYGINKSISIGKKQITLQLESELDDMEFYHSYSGYFEQLKKEWDSQLNEIAMMSQKKLRRIGQSKRVVEPKDIELVILTLVHTDEEHVYFRISFRILSKYSLQEADLFTEKSLVDLTGELDWSKLDLNVVNLD